MHLGKETYVLFKQDDEINWNYVPDKYKGRCGICFISCIAISG